MNIYTAALQYINLKCKYQTHYLKKKIEIPKKKSRTEKFFVIE